MELSAEEQAYINRLITWPDDALQRAYFEGAVECNMPVIVRQLQMERLDGRLRDNVIDDLIAYLYVTMEYNLLRYLRRNGGFDETLFIKLKDYLNTHKLRQNGWIYQTYEIDITVTSNFDETLILLQVPVENLS